ncbi:unnamed protein product [Linum tenue]|nr:unnamed protein product [Linum tenue]
MANPNSLCLILLLSSLALASATVFFEKKFEDNTKGSPELHLANRLDRDTSGVMIITKSHKVAAKLVKAFTLLLMLHQNHP